MASESLPRVFVISSTESKNILDVVVAQLNDEIAEVVPWNRDELWVPGKFIAEVLLALPYAFDFAVAIFGADDKVHYRGTEASQARDNVIFETGMFMSHLGRDRTFVVTPVGTELPVKMLTDLAGLNLLRFEVPAEIGGLNEALLPICQKINTHILKHKKRPGTVYVGPKGFFEGHNTIIEELRAQPSAGEALVFQNIALDMEHTWGLIRDHILGNQNAHNVTWRSLMLDWKSDEIKPLSSHSVDVKTAKSQEEKIVAFCTEHADAFQAHNIRFACKAYHHPPVLHGFLIGQRTLLLNLCGVGGNGLRSAGTYLVFKDEPPNQIAQDYIEVFSSWFDHEWNESRSIWPVSTDTPDQLSMHAG